MLHMMEQPGYKSPFTLHQASCLKYPIQFLCDLANAILDNKTGNLLEYHHLLKYPKQKDIWSKSFRTEIRCLATTMEIIFFKCKDKIPANRCKYITYGCIVCNVLTNPRRKLPIAQESQWEEILSTILTTVELLQQTF
jgi:hypothetical protein